MRDFEFPKHSCFCCFSVFKCFTNTYNNDKTVEKAETRKFQNKFANANIYFYNISR